jgi:hypothetical protein
MMDRRAFVAGTLALLAVPLAAQPQSAYRIGFLSESTALATLVDRSDVCVQRLLVGFQELGYTEGRNLLLEPRSAEGRPERLRALADELVRLGVNAIVTGSNEAAHAASRRPRRSRSSWQRRSAPSRAASSRAWRGQVAI